MIYRLICLYTQNINISTHFCNEHSKGDYQIVDSLRFDNKKSDTTVNDPWYYHIRQHGCWYNISVVSQSHQIELALNGHYSINFFFYEWFVNFCNFIAACNCIQSEYVHSSDCFCNWQAQIIDLSVWQHHAKDPNRHLAFLLKHNVPLFNQRPLNQRHHPPFAETVILSS